MIRRLLLLIGLAALSACAPPVSDPPSPPTIAPAPSRTALSSPVPSPTPTSTPTLTLTPTATLTVTPSPTLDPRAITAETVSQLQMALVLRGHYGSVMGVAITPAGSLIATGSTDKAVRVFDGQTGDLLHTFERHRSLVYDVAFSPDGSRLVSGGQDYTVQVWNPLSGERVGGRRTSGEVAHVAFDPDGTRFAGAGYYSALGEVWSADGAPLAHLEGHDTRLRDVVWSWDGSFMATCDGQGIVIIRDGETTDPLYSLDAVIGAAEVVAISPDNRTLAVGSSRGVIALYTLADRRLAASWGAHRGHVSALTFSPDGSLLISAGPDETTRLWDVTRMSGVTGEYQAAPYRLLTLTGHGAPIRDAVISRDGRTLVTGGDDGRAIVWRLPR